MPPRKDVDGIAPTFSKKPTIRQEDGGRRLVFECKVTAEPAPTVTWKHGGTTVTASSRIKVRRSAKRSEIARKSLSSVTNRTSRRHPHVFSHLIASHR